MRDREELAGIGYFRKENCYGVSRAGDEGQGGHAFLINPYGMFFEEITASSLIKVDEEGRPLMDSEAVKPVVA